ncbi:hypothetical protein GYM62_02055 [Algoriphagus sp. NBT04N3]|uniref:hypothetical protein n=1 Tax=Algoriphagus sp. NBT04N3 TaxID=2705473 RepID=UPI001C634101|nr:hypothetical protein [Algoriphagus sp. NBT04N3]QYH37643.1 hypothetical protein GYM62_02055 [Algoriphagus sp. NBT04N3]
MGEALPLKKVELVTSYHFGSGSTGLYHNVAWEKRLKLDQVIFDSDHNYSFSYFGNLASRLSFDQDFYGYHIYSSVSTLTPYNANHNPNGADRSPNPSRINAGLLEIITFPTGGYNRFEYEPNWVFFGNSNQQGPGVRIKRISSYSDLNSLVKFTDYKYVQENESISSGFIDNLQSSVNFIDEQSQWQHDNDTGPYRLDCKFYVVSSDDQLSSFMGRTYNITYKRVEEIINDGSQGKIVYHFSQINDVIINTAPSLSSINYDWTHGLPIKTEIFKKEGSSFEKIEEKTFHYKTFITNTNSFQANAGPSSFYSFGMKLNRERAEVQPGQQWLFKPAEYNLFKYGYLSALLSKYKETSKLYKNGLTRESNIYFSIDSLNNQITKSVYKDINNPSNTMIRYYFYSDEINSQSAFFTYKNPLLFIDKKVYNGVEYTINGGYFPLISLNGRLLHNKAYRLDLAQPVSNYTLNLNQPELSQGFKLTNEVLNFNSKNYPELIKDNGIQTKIFYDYSDLKPTAYIRNFTGTNSDFAYTSFETNNQGGWNYTVLSRPIRITPFTGSIVHRLSGNPLTKNNLNQSRTYVLTFAVKKDGNAIPNLVVKKNGSIISDSGISNSDIGEKWIIYQYRLSSSSSVQIEGDGVLIDELRILPIESSITTYGYFPFIGLSYENPNSMIPVNYFYNGQRRLSMILNQNGERLKQYFYQYKAPISF